MRPLFTYRITNRASRRCEIATRTWRRCNAKGSKEQSLFDLASRNFAGRVASSLAQRGHGIWNPTSAEPRLHTVQRPKGGVLMLTTHVTRTPVPAVRHLHDHTLGQFPVASYADRDEGTVLIFAAIRCLVHDGLAAGSPGPHT